MLLHALLLESTKLLTKRGGKVDDFFLVNSQLGKEGEKEGRARVKEKEIGD